MPFDSKTLDEFLSKYGDELARRAREQLRPLHVPGRDKAEVSPLLRKPFPAQAHVVTAAVKQWGRAKAVQLVAEMGSGKTFMALGAIQSHADAGAPPPEGGSDMLRGVTHWVGLDYARDVLTAHLGQTQAAGGRGAVMKVSPFRHEGKTYFVDRADCLGTMGLTRGYCGVWKGCEIVPLAEWGGEGPAHVVAQGKKQYAVAGEVTFGVAVRSCYRALVVCPGQLVQKWAREIRETVPNAKVTVIEDYRDLLPLAEKSRAHRRLVGKMKADNRAIKRDRAAVRRMEKPAEDWRRWGRASACVELRPAGERPPGDPAALADNQLFRGGDGQTRRQMLEDFAQGGRECRLKPERPEYFVIGRDRLKLSSSWVHAYRRRAVGVRDREGDVVGSRWKVAGEATRDERCSRCPRCGHVLVNKDGELLEEKFLRRARRVCKYVMRPIDEMADGKLTRSMAVAAGCGEQLWQDVPKPRRHSPAKLIQKKLKGFFDYLVVDEAHEYKGTDSVQADAIGAVASACKKVAALTGTLVGGYAWHVRTLLFRIGAGGTMIGDGFGWKDETPWNEAYGRIETRIVEKAGDAHARGHKYAKGESEKKTSRAVPGIVPTMFKHLIGSSIFLSLDEVAADLPPFLEDVVEVELDNEQAPAYKEAADALTDAIRDMVRTGNKKLLGTMLNCLLAYPDYPFDWGMIGYTDKEGGFVPVVRPRSLDRGVLRPKEQALVERVLREREEGRQVWVYCQYTDKRDCLLRVREALEGQGVRVRVMRASVAPAEREEWINQNGVSAEVILSHPDLVKTGLDFFNRAAGHNYTTIMFYQTGYNLFTLRQAARRAWRIGQRRECRVLYFYYKGTMQERAMTLMGRKLSAANALEGRFSAEGLAAMAGDDENLEMALAKSLADGIKEEAATRAWSKLTTSLAPSSRFAPADGPPLDEFLAGFAAEMAALGVAV